MEHLKSGKIMMPKYKESMPLLKNVENSSIHAERFCKMKSIGDIIHLMEESNLLPKKIPTKSKIGDSIKFNLKGCSKNYKRTTAIL